MEQKNYCTMYIVRHGETEWNLKQLMMGHKDSPLTAKGITQAQDLRRRFGKIDFAAVFSSDSGRTKATANLITLEKNLAIKTTELLREKTFGKFEGGLMEDYVAALKKALNNKEEISQEERFHVKTGHGDESEAEVTARTITYLREIAAAYLGKNVLVVTHGGVMRMLLMHLGFGKREELLGSVGNTAYIKLLADGVDFFIKETVGITKKIL